MKRDKEGHYIMIKGSIQEEDITIINIYAPNIGAPQYVRQMLTGMKGEINNNTIIAGDFNTPLTPMDRSTTKTAGKTPRRGYFGDYSSISSTETISMLARTSHRG